MILNIVGIINQRCIPETCMLEHVTEMYEHAFPYCSSNINALKNATSSFYTFFNVYRNFSQEERYYINRVIDLCCDKKEYTKFQKQYKRFLNRPTNKQINIAIICFVLAHIFNIVCFYIGMRGLSLINVIPLGLCAYILYIGYKGVFNLKNLTPWEEKIPGGKLICFA